MKHPIKFALALTLGAVSLSNGQSVLSSGTISGTEIGNTPNYQYTLTLNALNGSAPVESFWFAWTPGNFFLQSTPTSVTQGPNGWTGDPVLGSIQFSEGTPLTAGNSMTFSFDSTVTPAQMANDGESVVYSGAIDDSPGQTIDVQTVQAVPEPSTVALLLAGSAIVGWQALRRRVAC